MTSISIKELDTRAKNVFSACARDNLSLSAHNQAVNKIRELKHLAASHGLQHETTKTGEYYLQRRRVKELGKSVEFPIDHILKFAHAGLSATVQFAVTDSPENFGTLSVDILMELPISSALLDKIGKKRRSLLAEGVELFQSNPEMVHHSSGITWVLKKAKIEQLYPLLPEISRNVAFGAKSTSLLREILVRDKSGKAIEEMLVLISKGKIAAETLIIGLRDCPEAVCVFLRGLPKLVTKSVSVQAMQVLSGWLLHLNETPRMQRPMVSGALAVLNGGLLQKKRLKPTEESILRTVQQATQNLRLLIDNDPSGFWAFLPVANPEKGVSKFAISPEAARLLVESLLKLQTGQYQATDVVEALALNMGLSQYEEKGARVSFDPSRHEDAAGGLLKGQSAEVVASGWQFQDAIILKAKVNQVPENA
jgi:hypothetical protein